VRLYILINLFILGILNDGFTQANNFVADNGIANDFHKVNIGKVTFMAKPIPFENYKSSDFLAEFKLNDSSDLNIRVFLAASLTNSLHLLAPELPADELIKKGNYQFSFYVDSKLIYTENLNAGAGSAESKNKMTIFRVPLVSTTNEDSWGRFLWNRFMVSGGEEALTEGSHILKIEIRSYLRKEEIKTGNLIAEGQLKLIIEKPKLSEKQIQVQPILPNSGWQKSRAGYDKEKIRLLNKAIAQNTFKEITSIIVIKKGKLLLEEYFNGAGRSTLHDTRSVGKSFASTLMGIAIQEGYIKSENQQLKEFYDLKQFANYSKQKDNITIKDLLKMSSAFNGSDADNNSPGNEENMYPTADWVKFVLDLPMDSNKTNGKQWDYFTAGVVLLGDILNKSVPGGLEKYADEKLFKPLGITKYQWQYTPKKVVNTAGSLQMSSLDFARYGLLYQNGGLSNRQQIIPAKWVEQTFTKQLQIPGTENEYYGYLFWNKTFTVNGKNYETFYCTGNGGNKIYIFKDLPLTIVITATAYNKPYAHPQADKIIQNYLLPALTK
jgi:CubicO group peptidase (beta-lactamase class C family)